MASEIEIGARVSIPSDTVSLATAQMLDGAVHRCDQRDKGELYVRGLLTDGARKSMQPMAERLGVDHQRLQQFITSSTWDYQIVRANIARWAAEAIDPGHLCHR